MRPRVPRLKPLCSRAAQLNQPEKAKPKASPRTEPPTPEVKSVTTEVPKETVSEKEEPLVIRPVEVPKPVLRPVTEGMGGAQHQTIQKRIKEAAEALGFLAIIEKKIPNGSVDLALQKSGAGIACEISVTTTIDHEFGNVQKCLETGFAQVAVISGKPQRLEQIKEAVVSGLGAEKSQRVGYHSPDGFIEWLKTVVAAEPAPVSTEPTVTVRRGRTVTRKTLNLTPEERQTKEAAHIALMAEVMRKKPQ